MVVIFTLFGVVMLVVAGVLLYYRRKTLKKTELMRSVETSAARDVSSRAPGTVVEVKGTLRCESPLKSEMAEQTCAYYLSQVIREYEETDRDADGDLKTRRRSEVVASNERVAPFVVEDGSGAVGVRGEGAEVDALEVTNRFERDTGGAGTISLGGMTVNLGGGARTVGYRYVENVLPIDAPVYVLGSVQEDGEIGAPTDEGEKGRFLISYRSEEQLEKKYRRDALLLTLIALGLAVFGLIFLAVGVGVGLA
ncbi:MAG TPA: E3 ubiquitin ligase family protein [Rubrobacteraceae bacterium]|nr:E3 ubiquitin ligase family protein [Rubrobacteraceae bacterium]